MKREKKTIKASTIDKHGNIVDCETEVVEIIAESAGDIIDLLASCRREASVFMIPPNKGDTIQRVQVWDCQEVEHKITEDDDSSVYAVGFRKAFYFTIGEHGPHEMGECYRKQIERKKDNKPIVLTEEQMSDVEEKFFEHDCFAIEDNVFMIDGHISVQTILDAADYIRQITSEL